MLNQSDFILFTDGVVKIGIEPEIVDDIISELDNSNIKKEYIAASTPHKIIQYEQFLIKRKLVTLSEFSDFICRTGYKTDSEREGWGWVWNSKWIKKVDVSWKNPFMNQNDRFYLDNPESFPVMQVSWNDAAEYTKWLGNQTGENIRLPFEYEWEILGNYAGIASIIKRPDIAKDEIMSDNDFLIQLKNKIHNSEFQLGFLWEWTLDWYTGYNENIINRDFGQIYKTLRGGSLLSESIQNSKEFRFRRCPTARSPYYGFRIVIGKNIS